MPTKDSRLLALESIIDELDDRYGKVMEILAGLEKRIWVLEAPYRGAQEARRRREEKEKAAKKKTAKKKTLKQKKEESLAKKVEREDSGDSGATTEHEAG